MKQSNLCWSAAVAAGLCLLAAPGHAENQAPKLDPNTATKPSPVAPPTTKLPSATKPPTAKPGPTAKPPTAKPPTVKPPTAKPPTAKPPTAKPPTAMPAPTTKPPTINPETPKLDPTVKKPTGPLKPASPLFQGKLNNGKAGLRGFVDLHTHPMSHLGFGGHLMHGAPGVGVLMPAGQIYRNNDCNHNPERARSQAEALGTCYSTHAGSDAIHNKCGNDIRRLVINGFEDGSHSNKTHDIAHPAGYPSFTRWPKHDDILHQQMWVDWMERAYKGGMRVMVSLAVNNYTLATGMETSAKNPRNDKASADVQIREMRRFVAKHPWMEIAYTADDLRRIVGEKDKMAVIIGVELDDMGDFMLNQSKPSPEAARAEVRRLHGLGVRYAFPIHLTDNFFGGTAVYENEANRANCFHHGDWWQLQCTDGTGRDEFGIKHKVDVDWDGFAPLKIGHCGHKAPVPTCKAGQGHMNKKSLTKEGEALISEMMRLGMLIDIDHASLKTVHDILEHTKTPGGGYPLVSGHNGLRAGLDGLPIKAGHAGNENERTKSQYIEIAKRKGIAGIGWGALRSDEWLKRVQAARTTGVAIALGSDINGMVIQPRQRAGCSKGKTCVTYDANFPKPGKWDYNNDGVAHIGLFPDVLRDVETQPQGAQVVDALFNGAEAFAVMWERAESLKSHADAGTTSNGITVTKAEYGRNCGITASKANITSFVTAQCLGKTSCDYEFTWAKWGGDPAPNLCSKEIVISYKCGTNSKTKKVMHTKTPQKIRLSCP
jgi:microsomal dipeptidase-like Zn-dependent dipeptidase